MRLLLAPGVRLLLAPGVALLLAPLPKDPARHPASARTIWAPLGIDPGPSRPLGLSIASSRTLGASTSDSRIKVH